MSQFLTIHRLHLTPLSPIHIGCGEDFEPTNYVIENGWLYGFDPSRAVLTDAQRQQLADVARRGSLLGIQRFFRDNASAFKPHAHVLMPVCRGVADLYEKRIGRAANTEADGKQVFNLLAIERHVHTGAQQLPFIPGSSFKGALRTAWLDELNDGKRPRDEDKIREKGSAFMEKRLLWGEGQRGKLGDFETSPLRLLKVADLMPICEPERQVLFAVNRKKRQVMKDGQEVQPKGIAARKDCVLPGQYRLFAADATLPNLLQQLGATNHKREALTPNKQLLTAQGGIDLKHIARQSNAYHQKRLHDELGVLDRRGMVNPNWKRGIEALTSDQSELGRKLKNGDAFLVRLGRYGGAESKTLSGEGVASIKIMGARGAKPSYESATKTVWLAAQNDNDQKHLIPFGWAVVEIDPEGDCAALQQWCQDQSRNRPNMANERARFQALRQAAEAQKTEQAAKAAARALALDAERQAAEQRAEDFARMTPQCQEIEKLRQACAEWADNLPPHGNYKKQLADANKTGLYQNASRLVKTALQSADWSAADKAELADMLAEWLPKVVAPWDAKEQRKKLQLAQLRGTA